MVFFHSDNILVWSLEQYLYKHLLPLYFALFSILAIRLFMVWTVRQHIADLPRWIHALSFLNLLAAVSSNTAFNLFSALNGCFPSKCSFLTCKLTLQHTLKRSQIIHFCLHAYPETGAIHWSVGLWWCCCDRQWIFLSLNTHPTSGWVTACWRPVSLTVPASSKAEP